MEHYEDLSLDSSKLPQFRRESPRNPSRNEERLIVGLPGGYHKGRPCHIKPGILCQEGFYLERGQG